MGLVSMVSRPERLATAKLEKNCEPPPNTVLQKGSSCGRGRKLPNKCFPTGFQGQILRSAVVRNE